MNRGTLMVTADDEGIAVGGHLPPTSPPVYLPYTPPPAPLTEALIGSGTAHPTAAGDVFLVFPGEPYFRGLRVRFQFTAPAPPGSDTWIALLGYSNPSPTRITPPVGDGQVTLTPGVDYGTVTTVSSPGSAGTAPPAAPVAGVWYDLDLAVLGTFWQTRLIDLNGNVLATSGSIGTALPEAAAVALWLTAEDTTVQYRLYAKRGPVSVPPPPTPPPPPPPPSGPYPPSPQLPPGAMRTGLSMGKWQTPAEARAAVNLVTVADGSASQIAAYIGAGVAVVDVIPGPYGAGVLSINPAAWAANAVAVYNASPGILAIEILNEPSGQWFWGSGADSAANAAAYARLIKAVRDAFTANGRRPLLLASYDGGHPGSSAWGQAVHDAGPAVWTYVDGITVHPYGGTGDRTLSAQGNRAAAAAAHAATGLPVWITEVGWPTAVGQPATGDSLQWTEAEQAANIVDLVNWARSTDYVGGLVIFMYQDYGSNNWYGITRIGGAHKTSFGALAAVS